MPTLRTAISFTLACLTTAAAATPSRSYTAACRASCYSYAADPAMCLMSCPQGYGVEAPSFGAIYYSEKTGKSGLSVRFATQQAAERHAHRMCEARSGQAGDCRRAIWFDRRCAALAVGRNNAWDTSYAVSLADAAVQALALCQKRGGIDCRIVESQCSN